MRWASVRLGNELVALGVPGELVDHREDRLEHLGAELGNLAVLNLRTRISPNGHVVYP